CGALGGLDGPSFGIFTTLSDELVDDGISSLRLDYRYPGDFGKCVLDMLVGVQFLKRQKIDRVVLAGHSFGAAVAIVAGTMSPDVRAVVGLSSQTYGAQDVAELAPKPLLLIHGSRDRNLPVECSELLYEWAEEPKELVIYQGSGHFLRECHDELHDLLKSWLRDKAGREK
ncbi:MAG: alpha/beta hydrolase, partial [Dehalococcoidia bacterium]